MKRKIAQSESRNVFVADLEGTIRRRNTLFWPFEINRSYADLIFLLFLEVKKSIKLHLKMDDSVYELENPSFIAFSSPKYEDHDFRCHSVIRESIEKAG